MGVVTKDKKTSKQNPEDEAPEVTEETGPETFEADGHTMTIIHDADAGPESMGVQPVLLEGQRVQVIAGEHTVGRGARMAYIIGHTFASDEDYLQFHTAGHPKRMFAEVETYQVETRDGRKERFSVTPEEIRTLEADNGWGRGSI